MHLWQPTRQPMQTGIGAAIKLAVKQVMPAHQMTIAMLAPSGHNQPQRPEGA
jgi:hypothetical protein